MQRPSGARVCSKVKAASRWVWLDCGPGLVPSVTRRFFLSTYYAPGTCEALDAAEERQPQSSGGRDKRTCGRVSLSAREGRWGAQGTRIWGPQVKPRRGCCGLGLAGRIQRLALSSVPSASPAHTCRLLGPQPERPPPGTQSLDDLSSCQQGTRAPHAQGLRCMRGKNPRSVSV